MERTEQPTGRRVAEARRKGEPVGRSHEIAQAATLVVGLAVLSAIMPAIGERILVVFRESIAAAGQPHATSGLVMDRLGAGFGMILSLLMPLFVAVAVTGVVGNLISGGFVFSLGSIRFDGKRMNPGSGLKRLISRDAAVRLFVNVGKFVALAVAAWLTIGNAVPAPHRDDRLADDRHRDRGRRGRSRASPSSSPSSRWGSRRPTGSARGGAPRRT